MTVLDIIIIGLSTWRVTSLLVNEDGPAGILATMRHRMGLRYDDYANPYIERYGSRWYHTILYHVADKMTCLWCLSMWIGGLFTIAYLILPSITPWLLLPFAASAVAVYLNTRARFRK